jgi:hypothetical protein
MIDPRLTVTSTGRHICARVSPPAAVQPLQPLHNEFALIDCSLAHDQLGGTLTPPGTWRRYLLHAADCGCPSFACSLSFFWCANLSHCSLWFVSVHHSFAFFHCLDLSLRLRSQESGPHQPRAFFVCPDLSLHLPSASSLRALNGERPNSRDGCKELKT